jgi:hypothetical protein
MKKYAVVAVLAVSLVMAGCTEEEDPAATNNPGSTQTATTSLQGTWSLAVVDVLAQSGSVSSSNIGNLYYFANGLVTRAFRGGGTYTTSSTTAGTAVRFNIELPDFPGFYMDFDGVISGSEMTGTVTVSWPPPTSSWITTSFTARKTSNGNALP